MKNNKKFVVYNLKETYYELGEYSFKIVLDPKFFKNCHMSDLELIDSDGNPMRFVVEKWGRKINCRFVVNKLVPDGVSTIKMNLRDEKNCLLENVTFWVVKP